MIVSQWFERKMNIAQTVWTGIQYSLLSDDNKQCHPFVCCKEFILDTIWGVINKRSVAVYGFYYSPELDPPASLGSMRCLLRNKEDEQFPERVYKCQKFLNLLEDQFGFPFTTVEPCENAEKTPTFLFTSPANWLHAPPLTSLLTLMMRVGMIYDGKMALWKHAEKVASGKVLPYQKRDNEHLARAYRCIRDLVDTKCARFLPERDKNWPVMQGKFAHMAIHEEGGIVSLSTGMGRYVCKDWYPKPPEPKPEEVVS